MTLGKALLCPMGDLAPEWVLGSLMGVEWVGEASGFDSSLRFRLDSGGHGGLTL